MTTDAKMFPPLRHSFETWSGVKLFERAEALQLPGRTHMTRAELIEALSID